jgi:hypothetical protein
MKALVISLVLITQINASSFESDELTNLYSLSSLDMLYTSKGLKSGTISEANPILGTDPTDARLMYTALSANALYTLVYWKLPQPWRSISAWTITAIEAYFSIDCAFNAHNRIRKNRGIPEYRDANFSFVIYRW